MTAPLDDLVDRLRAAAPPVTVVGEAILDRWQRGGAKRISREAPVPVVEVDGEEPEECPGGAANTAVNLASLGARVRLVTAIGDDADGRRLRQLVSQAGVDTSGFVVRTGSPTPSKTRILAGDQILVRVDHGVHEHLSVADRALLHERLREHDPESVLVVCDYGTGLLDAATIELLAGLPRPRTILVDAHDLRPWAALRPDLVTPNSVETELLLGRTLPAHGRPEAVGAAARDVLTASGAAAAVVTLDTDGTVVLERGEPTHRTYARPAPEHQASGAGDTFAAALAAASAIGADLRAAAGFAQRAADVVVARPGTSVCTLADLTSDGSETGSAPLSPEQLRAALQAERLRGRTVVFTNGCFDVLHLGHTRHLRQAKDLGDILVVALNDDDSVRRLKGPGRPVNPLEDRVAVLESLGCVDYVTVFPEDSPVGLIAALEPDIYAKGGDYSPEMLEETAVVRAHGGEVRILEYIPAHSTTQIVNRIVTGAAQG
jgi:D-beta-D-heptose 7-phosphate kinase/D-beta-D-heptose 1-phosphate adenosyltransferase